MVSQKEKTVVIIGGGISGLAAAYRLKVLSREKDLMLNILLIDAAEKVGGVIKTIKRHDCLLELGPDSMQTGKPWGLNLMKELGLDHEIVDTNENNRRAFVAQGNTLLPVPVGFRLIAPGSLIQLAASPCLSLWGKLRAAIEPFIPKNSSFANNKVPDNFDESLASFVRRRLGNETLERLAQPLFSGIYTADPEKLSLRATMPEFLNWEARYGSVVTGLKKSLQQKEDVSQSAGESVRYSMFVGLRHGMETLVDALINRLSSLGVEIRSSTSATLLRFDEPSKQWMVSLADGSELSADGLIVALPSYAASHLLSACNAEAAQLLAKIQYASSAVVNFIVERKNVLHALNGFGFLIPAIYRKSILAASFSSVKFDGRAPENLVVLRAFVGGALFQDILKLSDTEIRDRAFADLSQYLSIRSVSEQKSYLESVVTRWPNSMPQYDVGHIEIVREIEASMAKMSNVVLCGAGYSGVGIPDCVKNANNAAEKLLLSLL